MRHAGGGSAASAKQVDSGVGGRIDHDQSADHESKLLHEFSLRYCPALGAPDYYFIII